MRQVLYKKRELELSPVNAMLMVANLVLFLNPSSLSPKKLVDKLALRARVVTK